ncbi:MAG: aminotransferase class I/II-fold pyridoxal phosphate-dependent enzyme, partial [Alphaproteobacteria bacterium]|nr:aminotransferase class I/II-fold pyridoxal phosphate-dependent enzyme [Alphaproteobacteria bacterium]
MDTSWPILTVLTFLPMFGVVFLLLIRGNDAVVMRNSQNVALWVSSFTFLVSLFALLQFDSSLAGYQLQDRGQWLIRDGISYHMGVDGISMPFVVLTTFLTPLAILASWQSVKHRVREYMIAFLALETLMIGTFAALLNSGDHIISARAVFGSTHGLFTKFLPKWNIETTYFDVADLDRFEDLITPNTKVIYAESPTNPGLQVLDLERLGVLAKKHNLILIIDNCFATPYLQKPIAFGADLVIHSATKLIDGQGRVLGGITVGRADLIRE